jgi:hypothetical protein
MFGCLQYAPSDRPTFEAIHGGLLGDQMQAEYLDSDVVAAVQANAQLGNHWEIDPVNLIHLKTLGHGEFGEVSQMACRGLVPQGRVVFVAVKRLKQVRHG